LDGFVILEKASISTPALSQAERLVGEITKPSCAKYICVLEIPSFLIQLIDNQ
jgi:hypothetical protein